MNSKSLVTFTCTFMCISLFNLYSENSAHYNSDDILYGKDALERIISQGGAQIKIASQSSLEQDEELNKISELASAVDALTQEAKKSDARAQELHDVRHAVAFVKYFSELGLLAQRYFDDALPVIKVIKKRDSGFMWRDLGSATSKIWAESLAMQVFKNPSFRRLLPDAQIDLGTFLNKKFTGHFKSFMVQALLSSEQAKSAFAQFYAALPDAMVTIIKRHYPVFDASMIYNK